MNSEEEWKEEVLSSLEVLDGNGSSSVPWFYLNDILRKRFPELSSSVVHDLLLKMNREGLIELWERGSRRRGRFLYVSLPRQFEGRVFGKEQEMKTETMPQCPRGHEMTWRKDLEQWLCNQCRRSRRG